MKVPGRLHALLLLTWAVLRVVFKRWVLRRTDGIRQFRANYDADGLPPVSEHEREILGGFGRCIACGLCDRDEAGRIAASGGAYRGVMPLMLAASRSMPDFRAAAYSFGFVSDQELELKERDCPTGVPMRQIARFVREKADVVGGPLPLPRHVPSISSSATAAGAATTDERGEASVTKLPLASAPVAASSTPSADER
jgi:hypothetical protein